MKTDQTQAFPDTKAEPSRRSFLKRSMTGGAVVTAATLGSLTAHTALADDGDERIRRGGYRKRRGPASNYGDLLPAQDQDGNYILALPRGFQYATFSRIGDATSDGFIVPRNHDGMQAFDGPGRTVRLIRNHEVRNAPGDFDPARFSLTGPEGTRYDPVGVGGTMTIDFDPRSKRVVRQFISLNGTIVNCAGGFAYQQSGWITCEETTAGPTRGWGQKHGYNFLVPASANTTVPALALKWMGRFSHEAAVADDHGIVYQTEDAGNVSGFYRSVPNRRNNLAAGGTLEMLAVKGQMQADLWKELPVGSSYPVEWVNIDFPDPDLEGGAASVAAQGRAKGAAYFNRLEGIYLSEDGRSVYFLSTSGGYPDDATRGFGQLWHYIPADEKFNGEDRLVLVFQSPKGSVLESPDNMCLTPSGGVLFCEDDAVGDNDTHPLAGGLTDINRLIGIGKLGEPFEFAVNLLNDSEFAGACFSPDGEILFVNIFGNGTAGSGMTCAIWGPWERGPL